MGSIFLDPHPCWFTPRNVKHAVETKLHILPTPTPHSSINNPLALSWLGERNQGEGPARRALGAGRASRAWHVGRAGHRAPFPEGSWRCWTRRVLGAWGAILPFLPLTAASQCQCHEAPRSCALRSNLQEARDQRSDSKEQILPPGRSLPCPKLFWFLRTRDRARGCI